MGRGGSGSTRSPLPTRMAQETGFGLYSPECVEGEFSEGRLIGLHVSPTSSIAPALYLWLVCPKAIKQPKTVLLRVFVNPQSEGRLSPLLC